MASGTIDMHPRGFLQILLMLFIGLLLAGFIGFGVEAFYPGPQRTDYPVLTPAARTLDNPEKDPEFAAKLEEYRQKDEAFQAETKKHNKNVSLLVLGIAVLVLVVAVTVAPRIAPLDDGILLGGVFTLLYGVGRGMASEDFKFQFLVMGLGLVAVLVLAYLRFARPAKSAL